MGTRSVQITLVAAVLTAAALLSQGCSSGGDSSNNNAVSPITPFGVGSGTIIPSGSNSQTGAGGGTSYPYQSGATVPLTGSGLSEFFAARGVNSAYVQNPTINVDMSTVYSPVIIGGTYGGEFFGLALGTVNPTGSGYQNSQYNQWYTIGGQKIYKGFFQDAYGAILFIVTSETGVGDGEPGLASGSVYYQNFNLQYPNNPYQGPNAMCWQITAGNHDCRTYLQGGVINMTYSIYPDPGNHGPNMTIGYEPVGTFTGMDMSLTNF